MKSFATVQLLISVAFCTVVSAQHQHTEKKIIATKEPLTFESVASLILADPDLKGYKLESSILTIAPGGQDTVSHRHDCEVFGFVLEGDVQVGLEHKSAVTYKAGQLFYEKRNILHSLTANPSANNSTRILLMFLIKEGRNSYTEER
jgi:quercetin dioxygenase-like cupin family protein